MINLVDSASSYMLDSKIKPCKYKYKFLRMKLRKAHYNSYHWYSFTIIWISMVILELIQDRTSVIRSPFIQLRPKGILIMMKRRVVKEETYCLIFWPISLCRWGRGSQRLWRVTGNWGLIPEREPERWLPRLRMAAGAQITQSRFEEVVMKNNNTRHMRCDCDE